MAVRDFEIVVNGFHPVLLGMTREEIDDVMGEAPKADGKGLKGEETFRYDASGLRVVTRESRAVELALAPVASVRFKGRSLFEDPEVWRDIVAADGEPQETLGFVVLRNLGLTLTGFHDGDRGQLAITAFEPGRWDTLREQMTPLRL